MQPLDLDPDRAFYDQVARHCGKDHLNGIEANRVYKIRNIARQSYEQDGELTPPPGFYQASLLDMVVWFLTQDRLYREELKK